MCLNSQNSTSRMLNNYANKNKQGRSTMDHFSESFQLAKKRVNLNIKNSAAVPWFVPTKYRVAKPEENFDHTYTLTTASRMFVTFEEANSSKISYLVNIVITLVLVISCVQYVVVTLPSVQYQPDSCASPACEDDPLLCPGRYISELVNNLFHFLCTLCCR
jgi:hypothetical protein